MGTELAEDLFRRAHSIEGNVEFQAVASDEAGSLLAFSFAVEEDDYHHLFDNGLINDDFEVEATEMSLN